MGYYGHSASNSQTGQTGLSLALRGLTQRLGALAAVWLASTVAALAQATPVGTRQGFKQDPGAVTLPETLDVGTFYDTWAPLIRTWLSYAVMGFLVLAIIRSARIKSLMSRVWKTIEEDVLTNWRLALLAATSLVLSIASGWTTWDGMKNFTGEPLLSFMITFGIQGVMLIAAWLIGESFAVGMRPGEGSADNAGKAVLGGLVAVALVIGAAAVWIHPDKFGLFSREKGDQAALAWMLGGAGAAMAGIGLAAYFAKNDVVMPYLWGIRTVAKNAVLWVMFLACMATSVFFSFDSLFTAIFPQDERKRAADIRAGNQVAGVIADTGALIKRRRLEEIDRLFDSEAWKHFDGKLDDLVKIARTAPKEIEDHYKAKLESRQQQTARQQEEMATANSSLASLTTRKALLADELARLEGDKPRLQAELTQARNELNDKLRENEAKKAETLAEARGIGGTGKIGEGPKFRELREVQIKAQNAVTQATEQFKRVEGEFDKVSKRIVGIKSEQAQLDGEIAKLKGRTETAEQLIKVTKDAMASDQAPKLDASGGLFTLEGTRNQFRTRPEEAGLAGLQQVCSQMLSNFSELPKLRQQLIDKKIDCDPSAASEAAGRVFALNSGMVRFEDKCAKGENLQIGNTDKMLDFGARCIQDSGLAGQDTAALRGVLNRVALNRDDKAHRFVVTWNAFLDQNRLAYLALGIAIAIDALVFMSGLFGANATVTPLASSPRGKNKTAAELDAIIENALAPPSGDLPDRLLTPVQRQLNNLHLTKLQVTELVLAQIQPVSNTGDYKGVRDELSYMGKVVLRRDSDQVLVELARNFANAGATLGLVESEHDRDVRLKISPPGQDTVYFIRSELYEKLALVRVRELARRPAAAKSAEPVRLPPDLEEIERHDRNVTRLPRPEGPDPDMPNIVRRTAESQSAPERRGALGGFIRRLRG